MHLGRQKERKKSIRIALLLYTPEWNIIGRLIANPNILIASFIAAIEGLYRMDKKIRSFIFRQPLRRL